MNKKIEISKAEYTALQVLKNSNRFENWTFDPGVYLRLEARFGETLPKNGVVFPTPCRRSKGKLVIDSYGWGDVHNVRTPTDFSRRKRRNWNQPCPMPADLSQVVEMLDVASRGRNPKDVTLGQNSDPFMWMDMKYRITQGILELLASYSYCINSLEIHTRSDLIAHDDYIARLALLGFKTTIFIHMPRAGQETVRIIEPGAPSIERRFAAARKLKASGFKVRIVREGSIKKNRELVLKAA